MTHPATCRVVYSGPDPVELVDGTLCEPGVPIDVPWAAAHGTPAVHGPDGELVHAGEDGLLARPDFTAAEKPAKSKPAPSGDNHPEEG